MPPKAKKLKKPKKKISQKQIVKTNVRVNVQSSGGSGAGGSIPPTAGIPNAFNEARLATLIEQIGRRVPIQQPVFVNSGMPINEPVAAARFEPANDAATLNAVFMGESDLLQPLTTAGPERKPRKPYTRRPVSERMTEEQAGYISLPSSEGEIETAAEFRRQEREARLKFKNYGEKASFVDE